MDIDNLETRVVARETKGGLPAAYEALDAILKADPRNEEALRLKSKYQKMADELLTVIEKQRAIVAANPAARLEGKLAYGYKWFGNVPASLAEYDREIALEPGNPALLVYRARVKRLAGDGIGARDDMNAAALMSRKAAAIWAELGEFEAEDGNNEAALQNLERAITAQPGWRYIFNRGVFRCKLERWKEALFDLDAVVYEIVDQNDLEEFQQVAFRCRGHCRFMLGEEEALEDLDMAISLKADDALALCLRGSIYAARGDAAGLKDLDEAIRLEPAAAFAYASRGDLHLALGDKAAALRDYHRAVELDPKFQKSLKESILQAETE